MLIHSAHVLPACLTALLRMGVGAGLTGATGATGLTGATGSVLLTLQGNFFMFIQYIALCTQTYPNQLRAADFFGAINEVQAMRFFMLTNL